MSLSFRTKLFVSFIVIILLTSVPVGTVIYNFAYDSLESNNYSVMSRELRRIDNTITSIFQDLKNDTKFMANNAVITKADNLTSPILKQPVFDSSEVSSAGITNVEMNIYNEFQNYIKSHPEVSYIYLGTIWGDFVQWPRGVVTTDYNPKVRPWYEEAMAHPDEVILTTPYKSLDRNSSITISASSTIRSSAGDIIGVISVDTNFNNLSEMIKNITIGNNGYLFMYDNDGTIMTHPDNNLIFKDITELSAGIDTTNGGIGEIGKHYIKDYKKLLQYNDLSFETEINGEPVLISILSSSSTAWKLASIVPKREIIVQASYIGYAIVVITLLVIASSIFIANILSKRLTKPLTEMTALMHEAGDGNLTVKANIKTKDEFGQLSTSFNSMINKLYLNYEELNAVHEELVATDDELRFQYGELQSKEEALRNSEERYKLALDGSNDALWEWNMQTGEFNASERWSSLTGSDQPTHLNLERVVNIIIHPDEAKKARLKFEDHLLGKLDFFKDEFRIKTKDNSYRWILCRAKALRNELGKAIKMAGSITDISERKANEEKMKHMAYYDTLTDFPNRTLFMKKLNEELHITSERDRQGAVLFIDLDNFKYINDTLGHNYGDALLKSLAEKLKSIKRDSDTFCRFGGDEFIILHPFVEDDNIIGYAEELLSIFYTPFEVEGKQIFTTASIGIALYPRDGNEASILLKNADTAMYKAKALGKSTFALFDKDMFLKLERKTQIERALRTALDCNEFILYYQPQYSVDKKEICGFEALIRLNSRKLGFVSPAEFIPIAEETGHIVEIGKWVLREACTKAVEWKKKDYRIGRIAVNVSSLQIHHLNFINMVREVIAETGILPEDIELEITETTLMQSLDSSVKILNQLKAMGIKIALDDFGTGYSSLNYLRKIPIDTLKIDKSFIDNLCCNTKEVAIVESIIQMAHNMNLQVVAEGVETDSQLSILKEKHCDNIQGYLFSKPLPVDGMENLLNSLKGNSSEIWCDSPLSSRL